MSGVSESSEDDETSSDLDEEGEPIIFNTDWDESGLIRVLSPGQTGLDEPVNPVKLAEIGRQSTTEEFSDEESEGDDKDRGDSLSELPTTLAGGWPHLCDRDQDYAQGLSGTTPPKHGRSEKMARKGHKQKSVAYGPLTLQPRTKTKSDKPHLKKRPYSEINLSSQLVAAKATKESRRHTIGMKPHHSSKKMKKRRLTGGGGSGHFSPQTLEENISKSSKKKRKQEAKKRKQDRDDKSSLQQERIGSVASMSSVTELTVKIDDSDIDGDTYSGASKSPSYLTASLRVPSLRDDIRRVQSDAHLASLPVQGSQERQYCPPDRKKFFRNFVKALQYSGISSGPRNRMDSAPIGVHHVSRMHSENLALANPFGKLYEGIWLELQAYLHDRTPEEHQEWLFFKDSFADQVLNRIIDFKMAGINPAQSLNCTQFYNGYESLNSVHSTPILSSLAHNPVSGRLNFDEMTAEGNKDQPSSSSQLASGEGYDEPDTPTPCKGCACAVEDQSKLPHQESVESKSSHESTGKLDTKAFLSVIQLSAIEKVGSLLNELEQVEGLYPNKKRMGDEHSKYRTPNFKRRIRALTLWLKVTDGLASKLCSLSSLMGVAVSSPDVCQDFDQLAPEIIGRSVSAPLRTRSNSASNRSPQLLCRQDSREPGGIIRLSGSPPKSPKSPKFKLKFDIGPPEEDADVLQSISVTSLKRQMSTPSSVTRTHSSSNSTTTLQRLFNNYQPDLNEGPYRVFMNKMLKRKGLKYVVKMLEKSIKPVLRLAKEAIEPPTTNMTSDLNETSDDFTDEERQPLLKKYLPHEPRPQQVHEPREVLYERSTSMGPENWVQEFEMMNLPLFSQQYIQLIHVPLDVMHECLRLQQEINVPLKPSLHSVKQLVQECRDALEAAISVRKFYMDNMEIVTRNNQAKQEQVHNDLELFEEDLKCVLEIYFNYLQSWVQSSSGHVLEEEWKHIKTICTNIRGGEAEAGRRFCDMASQLLESTGDLLDERLDHCCSVLHQSGDSTDRKRPPPTELCRPFKELFSAIRERASKALGFAKMLRKDLEIAADFTIQTSTPELLKALQASDYVQVVFPQQRLGKLMFVPESAAGNPEEIQQLLSVSFAHGGLNTHIDLKHSYLLLVNLDVTESQASWCGKTTPIKVSAETVIAISEIEVDSLKMIVSSSVNLGTCRNDFVSAVGKAVTLTNDQTSSHQNVAERIKDLKMAACELGKKLMDTAERVTDHLSMEDTSNSDEHVQPYLGTMHACFNLGFEYIREVFRLLGDDMAYQHLGEEMLEYANVWMRFVLEKCVRGRGTKPRWATTGLEFLKTACAPRMLATISQSKFESLKKLMNRCVNHVVGEAPPSISAMRPEVHPVTSVRKSWSKPSRPPKLPTGAKGFSFSGTSSISPVAEEEEGYGLRSQYGRRRPSVEQGIVRVDPVEEMLDPHALETISGTDDDHTLLTTPSAVASPPISTGSLDSVDNSSGVDSPLNHSTDSVTNTVSYSPAPIPSIKCPPKPFSAISTPTLEHMDSNTSVASASKHYSSFLRSSSGESLSRSESSDSSIVEVTFRQRQIQDKIKIMEKNREDKLKKHKMIGHVTAKEVSTHELQLTNLMATNFKWQRGRKLGEGRFGKVYECRNLDNGEMNAVKQIPLQEKDTSAIQTIIDEISQIQRVKHDNIVKFYGVEMHINELYMFMEYCNEGTLWAAAQQGLPESMIRRYTRDLLRAVYKLHEMGIVHRDIKGANIFLSSNGSIKLGDFGLSVQLKNFQKTMQNEIKQQVGTIPYMAPEVILKQDMGRPMDIWSVGCVVVEMVTGKLPWSECDNQFTIMYRLGFGKSPSISEGALSQEGHDFLSKCFITDPSKRWKAGRLLDHNFVKVSDAD